MYKLHILWYNKLYKGGFVMEQKAWMKPIWKTNKNGWKNPLHNMCSYLAMFPPALPHYFIKQFTDPGEIVFDPFSGRGTTVLEACLNNRIGIGSDLNPLAVVLTGAKAKVPSCSAIKQRIQELENEYSPPDTLEVTDDIRMLYDESITLPMLVYMKESLNINNDIDRFIMATLMGVMHGKQRKDGTSIYLSISMPNTFSMSPNYVKNFIKSHNLKKHKQNVFDILRNRIDTVYPFNVLLKEGEVYQADALKISNNQDIFDENCVSLIVTSPPYLKLIKYGKYNWIRLWLLGEKGNTVDEKLKINKAYEDSQKIKLSDGLTLEEYLDFMKNLIIGWERILKDGALAVVVIGDVDNYKGKYLNLAEEVWGYVKTYTSLKLVAIIKDEIEGNNKVTKIWGQDRKGNATKADKLLILSKGEPRKPNFRRNIEKKFDYLYK